MIKSNKCSYKLGVNTKQKHRYITPELAIAAANKLNSLPNTIKQFKPYKCTVCHFFHIGRSHDDLPAKVIVQEIKPTVIEHKPEPTQIVVIQHDDFDWNTDKRIW